MKTEFEKTLTVAEATGPKVLKRQAQEETRLRTLGATDVTLPSITSVLKYLDGREFSRTIPARDELLKRLVGLTQGQTVPLVVFNCLGFVWQEKSGSYPTATILDDSESSICRYFEQQIGETVNVLGSLSPRGNSAVDLCAIIPDSELFDTRVFPFLQPFEERVEIATKVKLELSERLANFPTDTGNPVMFWSEYCQKYELASPMEFTAENADRLKKAGFAGDSNPGERNIYKALRKQVEDSGQYLTKNGLDYPYVAYGIPSGEREERTLWYCAMYMGEGQALSESRALVLNFEDLRVGRWFNIGSLDKLPIITPVNPSEYYQWRNSRKEPIFPASKSKGRDEK